MKILRSLLLFWCCTKRNGCNSWNYWKGSISRRIRTPTCAIVCDKSSLNFGASPTVILPFGKIRWGSSSQSTANKIIRTHSDECVLIILAGAGGFEPATHGFGVALNIRKAMKMLAFSPVSTHFSCKTVCRSCVWNFLILFWCYKKIPPFIVATSVIWCSSTLKFCIAEDKEKPREKSWIYFHKSVGLSLFCDMLLC